MKLTAEHSFASPEAAARKLVELAAGIEPVQDGRIHIEKINAPFLYKLKGKGPEFVAGIKYADEQGWLELHESGTHVRLLARTKELLEQERRPSPSAFPLKLASTPQASEGGPDRSPHNPRAAGAVPSHHMQRGPFSIVRCACE